MEEPRKSGKTNSSGKWLKSWKMILKISQTHRKSWILLKEAKAITWNNVCHCVVSVHPFNAATYMYTKMVLTCIWLWKKAKQHEKSRKVVEFGSHNFLKEPWSVFTSLENVCCKPAFKPMYSSGKPSKTFQQVSLILLEKWQDNCAKSFILLWNFLSPLMKF